MTSHTFSFFYWKFILAPPLRFFLIYSKAIYLMFQRYELIIKDFQKFNSNMLMFTNRITKLILNSLIPN